MALPNIVSPSTINLKNARVSPGTAATTVVTCAANKSIKISSLFAANRDGASAADVTCILNVSGVTHAIASTVSVPADATLVVIDRNSTVYLEEGHVLEAIASAAGAIQIVASYEEIA